MAKKQLHEGMKWMYRVTGFWIMFPFLIMAIIFAVAPMNVMVVAILMLILAGAILALIELYVHLAYERWFYEFGKESLRLERGVIWKRYSNIPYERVQNVDIHRGVIARIMGFSTVVIQTAGYSHPAAAYSEGYIPAVDINEAEEIREFLMKKISRKSKAGL